MRGIRANKWQTRGCGEEIYFMHCALSQGSSSAGFSFLLPYAIETIWGHPPIDAKSPPPNRSARPSLLLSVRC